MKHAAIATACFTALAACLSGCVARGPLMADRAIELTQTPFFPQEKFQCGPAALATVLTASGVDTNAERLTDLLYLPARRGSLQLEMLATPRQFARLALRLPRQPEGIVAELRAGRPVLVLHNYGLAFWPRWHYAVVVGYDPARDVFLMRSGLERRQSMRTRRFMVAWHHAGRWAMVLLRPGETATLDDAQSYLEAAATFERSARPEDARAAFEAATRRWPGEVMAWVGKGTAEYRLGQRETAARDYQHALLLDPAHAGARNNLAQALLDLHCPHRARGAMAGLDAASLDEPLRSAALDTQRQIEAVLSPTDAPPADAPGCERFP